MFRAACVTAVLVAVVSTSLPAQKRSREVFGRADWCDDDYNRRNGTTECRILQATVENTRVLDVDAGQNGGISVRTWNRNEIDIRVRTTAWARTASRARDVVDSVRLSVADGRVRATSPGGDRDWAANFELQIPPNTRLTLKASNGGLSLDRFEGTAQIDTVNGGITVIDSSGDIRGLTRNGGIAVFLTGRRWEGRGLDVATRNGGVSLLVPRGYSAELETGTSNGHMRIGFPITVTGTLNRQIRTRLGSGGAPIRALTTNGGVTIMQR